MFIFVVISILIMCVEIIINQNKYARAVKKLPGYRDHFILGNMLKMLVPPEELFRLGRDSAKKFDGIYRFWAMGIGVVNLCKPDDIETVISSYKFNDKSKIYDFLSPWLREGLLLSRGQKWRQRRKVLTPAFHFNILKKFAVILEENSHKLVDRIAEDHEQKLNIIPVLSEYTLKSICETAMGTQLRDEKGGGAYKGAIHELGQLLVKRFRNILYYSDAIFKHTSIGKQQKKSLDIVHDFTKAVIKERKQHIDLDELQNLEDDGGDDVYLSKKKKEAMLDLLLLAQRKEEIDSVGIQEEVDTFMFEGHDTTATGLIYCFMCIANYKDIQDKIVAELNGMFGESKRPATIEDFANMRYLDCVIKESLRLYPPVPFISRQLNEEVVLSNYTVPAGTMCYIHIFDLHRREDLFEDPERFDPDRFTPENSAGRHPYAYLPFSAGPRNCIGQKFAMIEMKSAVAAVLREYELIPVTRPEDLDFQSDLVLRTCSPVYVSFTKRR